MCIRDRVGGVPVAELERNQSNCVLTSFVQGRRSLHHPNDEDLSLGTRSVGRVDFRSAVDVYKRQAYGGVEDDCGGGGKNAVGSNSWNVRDSAEFGEVDPVSNRSFS